MVSELIVKPGGKLQGSIKIPGDKSISHRAIMLGAIAEGITRISGFLEAEDTLATLAAFEAMGVVIERPAKSEVVIHGVGLDGLKAPQHVLYVGNSGTSMRLLSGLLAGQSFDVELTGDESLSKRPMLRVSEPLNLMGANISCESDGKPPIRIKSIQKKNDQKLTGIIYDLPVASAQVKSALLLAGLYAEGETKINEKGILRDHTERMLEGFGYSITYGENPDKKISSSLSGGGKLTAQSIVVPGDISSATFFIVGACIAQGSDLILENVGINPTRDGVLRILKLMGANIQSLREYQAGGEPVADLHIKSSELNGITIPPEFVPTAIDEFPAIFIAAACAKGKTILRGAAEMRVKESDRIAVMEEGLLRLGVDAEALPDGMIINGGDIKGGTIDSHGDHRIAMSFAIAALCAKATINIQDCENVATSFPEFFDLAKSTGLNISEANETKYPPVITIDGPSGTGKGTLCGRLAERLGWHLLDSGSLYRVLGLIISNKNIAIDNLDQITKEALEMNLSFKNSDELVSIFLNNKDISDQIRTEEAGNLASKIAVIPDVREALYERQKAFQKAPGLIADGRDMGTVVFPQANLKIYLTASPTKRAERRYKQLKCKGISVTVAQLLAEIAERDERDSQRQIAPLKPADDAIVIDTSNLGIDDVESKVMSLIEQLGILSQE
ncbi:MAG: 3-phosphoshikimate 1-carboxyvinyltransferase [Gammaproteobacteria bacterium]